MSKLVDQVKDLKTEVKKLKTEVAGVAHVEVSLKEKPDNGDDYRG